MVTPLSALPAKLDKLANVVATGRKETITDLVAFAEKEFAAGPPRSGLGKNSLLAGKPWSVKSNVTGDGAGGATGEVSYKGPVHWINSGTDEHWVVPKGFVGSRRTRGERAEAGTLRLSKAKVGRGARTAIKLKGGNIRAAVKHRGAKADPFWPTVKRRVETGAPKIAKANLARNIAKAGFGR